MIEGLKGFGYADKRLKLDGTSSLSKKSGLLIITIDKLISQIQSVQGVLAIDQMWKEKEK